jgi:hypothetical protein
LELVEDDADLIVRKIEWMNGIGGACGERGLRG